MHNFCAQKPNGTHTNTLKIFATKKERSKNLWRSSKATRTTAQRPGSSEKKCTQVKPVACRPICPCTDARQQQQQQQPLRLISLSASPTTTHYTDNTIWAHYAFCFQYYGIINLQSSLEEKGEETCVHLLTHSLSHSLIHIHSITSTEGITDRLRQQSPMWLTSSQHRFDFDLAHFFHTRVSVVSLSCLCQHTGKTVSLCVLAKSD